MYLLLTVIVYQLVRWVGPVCFRSILLHSQSFVWNVFITN